MTSDELKKELEKVGYPTDEEMQAITDKCAELGAYFAMGAGLQDDEDCNFFESTGRPKDMSYVASDAISIGTDMAVRHFKETHPNADERTVWLMGKMMTDRIIYEVERQFDNEENEYDREPETEDRPSRVGERRYS